jgi:riboflavin kinase/FMN adenylyltransferase
LADGRAFFGVASVGCNPTLPKEAPVLEVWLFDFNEDIYDQVLSTELLTYLREEHRFTSVTALIDQVFADAEQARRYCEEHALPLT